MTDLDRAMLVYLADTKDIGHSNQGRHEREMTVLDTVSVSGWLQIWESVQKRTPTLGINGRDIWPEMKIT